MSAYDYHVIVYQILEYLYECLKNGEDVSLEALKKYKEDLPINDKYWNYILRHLVEDNLVEGVKHISVLNSRNKKLAFTEDTAITPKGISYLMEDSMMKKVCNVLVDGAKTLATSIITSYATK